MSNIEISEVVTARERDAFIKFPWQIYAGDPAWVPPLIIERKRFLDRKRHPFYQHGDAALFVARNAGSVVGRIMACDDRNYNALHESNVGCFGLFECVNDRRVARALFETAEGWLRNRGRGEMMGPIDYSTNYVCGLLIDGFQFPPAILTAHNPPYYRDLVESCGLAKAKDWYGWWFADPSRARDNLRRIAERFQKRGSDVVIRPADLRHLSSEANRLRQIFNEAWQKNWGFVPFSEAEIEFMARELKPFLIPEFAWVAEAKGQPVGFTLCLPDINVILRELNGRLTRFGLPIGLIKLLLCGKRLKRGRLIALGVVPKHRRTGVGEMLVLRVMEETMVKRGISGELSMTLDDNVLINRFLQAIGAQHYKTWRIYSKSIA